MKTARAGRTRRLLLVLGTGLALVPALTTSAAFQDMTSLLDGGASRGRWQAYFMPSPAGAIETAKLAFADPSGGGERLPQGAGLAAAGGVYTIDTVRQAFDTPDEDRVNRREKTSRVIAVSPVQAVAPPKAFSAGSILERQSLLRPGAGVGGPDVRTAFAMRAGADTAIAVALTFEPKLRPGDAGPGGRGDRVMVASLGPAKDGRARKGPVAADTAALGYAPAEPAENPAASLFGRILEAAPGGRAAAGFVPPIGKDDHSWAATPLPVSAYSGREQTCLATGIYFEARGESAGGQAAVAQVILNRVRNPTYPKTICGVVYQNKSWLNRCQFSFACDGIKDRIFNKRAYARAKIVADQVTRGEIWLPEVGSATHYHATYVKPRWASAMRKVDKIGRHVFYRTYGGGWR